MDYYGDWLDQANYITHYGVGHLNGGHSGRYPWGSGARPRQSEDLSLHRMAKENLNGAKIRNLNKWGSGPNSNVLYITGVSGSGKSTVALSMKRRNDTVIHLDGYTENKAHLHSIQDKKFNSYLEKHLPGWKYIQSADFNNSAYWRMVDSFHNAIRSYAKEEYRNRGRVIVDGVGVKDWLVDDVKYYNDQPYIELTTDATLANSRAAERDKDV